LLFSSFFSFSQQSLSYNVTPNGVLDNVFDKEGNRYSLSDLMVSDQNSGNLNRSTLITCSTTSYFNLYFEPGCGMDNLTDVNHIARRAVVCKVFEDIANFINSPLTTPEILTIYLALL
jgi:hypothetical protein